MSRIASTPFRLPNLTVPSIDLSHFEWKGLKSIDDKVAGAARDAAYITIGFGVLAFQQAQVRRRDLEKAVAGRVRTGREQLDGVVRTIKG